MLTPERALLSLVNNILNYVRIEAGQLRYASERVPLHTLVTDLEALVSPQLGAKSFISASASARRRAAWW